MFIVLKTEKPVKGLLKKRKQQKKLIKSEPILHSTENGLPFFVLDIPEENNETFRTVIEEKCGKYVSRVVAPRSLLLPDNGRIKRFKPVISNGVFLFNTAFEAIKHANFKPEETCITVTDRRAHMNSEIHRIIPYASSVRVITSHPERYSTACHKIYDEFGASVVIRPIYCSAKKREIIICCDGATTEEMRESAVFSFRHNNHGMLRFYSDKIELSENHKEIIPQNIETVDFAAAVTELCGSAEYKHSPFSQTEISCNKCADTTASKCLECYTEGKIINA